MERGQSDAVVVAFIAHRHRHRHFHEQTVAFHEFRIQFERSGNFGNCLFVVGLHRGKLLFGRFVCGPVAACAEAVCLEIFSQCQVRSVGAWRGLYPFLE
jgi:hypothetical protein